MVADLEKTLNIKIPMPLESDECNKFLKETCDRLGAECQPPHTTARLLDTLTAAGGQPGPLCVARRELEF